MKADKAIGTTGKGIGPAYGDKVARVGHRVGELYNVPLLASKIVDFFVQNESLFNAMGVEKPVKEELIEELNLYAKKLLPYVVDTTQLIWKALEDDNKILLEGAQGTMLDIDHGTYPFVTSSTTISSGACSGLGINPKDLGTVVGIRKGVLYPCG